MVMFVVIFMFIFLNIFILLECPLMSITLILLIKFWQQNVLDKAIDIKILSAAFWLSV